MLNISTSQASENQSNDVLPFLSVVSAKILKSDPVLLVMTQGSRHPHSPLPGRQISLFGKEKKSGNSCGNYKDTHIPWV